jgi:hypothetical protein
VLTDLDVKYVRLGWSSMFLTNESETFKIGPMADVKAFFIESSLDAPEFLISDSYSIVIGFPTLGVCTEINPIAGLGIFGEISGMYAGSYGHTFDAEFGAKYTFDLGAVKPSLLAGYRVFKLKGEYEDDYADLKLDGLYVGASVGF